MNTCFTTLQTHVRIEMDSVCSKGEIDAYSRKTSKKIDTFVDFITTWITPPRRKIV